LLLLEHELYLNGKNYALLRAAEEGCFDFVLLLLDHNADVNVKAGKGKMVLLYAVAIGHVDLV